jgi:hypothetical protein
MRPLRVAALGSCFVLVLTACQTSGFSALHTVNPVMLGPVPSLGSGPAPAGSSLGPFQARSANSLDYIVFYSDDGTGPGVASSQEASSPNEGDLRVLLATAGDPAQRVATNHIRCGGYDYNLFFLWLSAKSWCETSGDMIVPPPTAAPVNAKVFVAPADVRPEVTTADPAEVTVTTEPPEPLYEEQTDSIGPGYVWTRGYWGWSGADWAWYPGAWLMAPEGRLYIEPYYERVNGNVVYVGGYWGAAEAPRRSYGGDQIVFAAAVRPSDYRRGEQVGVVHSAGAQPGSRPASAYMHASGTVRPLPTRVESPRTLATGAPRQIQPAPYRAAQGSVATSPARSAPPAPPHKRK